MRPVTHALVLVALALGCASKGAAPPEGLPPGAERVAAPPQSPEIPASPPPSPTAPLPVPSLPSERPTEPATPPARSEPPSTPATSPAPKAIPTVSPRVDNEAQATREVRARLARAGQVIDRIDPGKLANDQREMFSSIQDFISKAQEALQARDVPRARILANKASKLADDLALALKSSK